MARKQLVPLDLNSNRVTNVADPTADQDAATKIYVDSSPGVGGVPTLLYQGKPYRVFNSGTSTYVSRYSKPTEDVVITKILLRNTSLTSATTAFVAVATSATLQTLLVYDVSLPIRGVMEINDIWVPLKTNELIAAGSIVSAASELTSYLSVSIYGEVFT